jgi:hypothetical protein
MRLRREREQAQTTDFLAPDVALLGELAMLGAFMGANVGLRRKVTAGISELAADDELEGATGAAAVTALADGCAKTSDIRYPMLHLVGTTAANAWWSSGKEQKYQTAKRNESARG